MPPLISTDSLADLITLTSLEIVLGIDNLVLLAIMVARLESAQQKSARQLGLLLAMLTRILLLCTVNWMSHLTATLFTIRSFEFDVSGRDLVLFVGGLFLIGKATQEIHDRLERDDDEVQAPRAHSFWLVVVQIALIDIVFSLDSVITAVGIADHLLVMIIAVMISVFIMMVFSGPIAEFINAHPSVKMLALSFLVLIGVLLVAEATHHHINKGYVYFAMAYSMFVEGLNLKRKRNKRVRRETLRLKREAAGG